MSNAAHLLWQNQDLDDEETEEDNVRTRDVIFEGWQGHRPILWGENKCIFITDASHVAF